MLVAAAGLIGGFALKGRCLAPWAEGHQYRGLCYNDIQALYPDFRDEHGDIVGRGVNARVFPYTAGELRSDGALVNGAIEYPVLTGVFMWASGAAASDPNEYFLHSVLLLGPFGFLTAYLLARMTGIRALMWAAAPALVLYAFHNWDLLAVAAVAGGFYLWHKGAPRASAATFAVGAALKMFPALFVAPLALERWRDGDRKGAGEVAAVGAGTFALINLPFIVKNFSGWWATYEFHRARGPNFDSIWNLTSFGPISLPRLDVGALNLVTTLGLLSFFAIALGVGWLRARKEIAYPVVPVCGALLAAFLLWNKVHSPQYALWILPFFVLTAVSIGWWVAYTVVDFVVYVGVFRFFFDYTTQGVFESTAQDMMEVGVWLRAILLLLLFVVFLRSSDSLTHPPATLEPVGEAA